MPSTESSIEFGVKILQDIVTAAYSFLKEEEQEQNLFQKVTRKYVKGLLERYGKVKVLGQREPIDLMQLYVRVNVLEKITARMGADIHELEKFFDPRKPNFYKRLETIDGEEIANKLDKFIVLGKPGAGKTTFLRYIAMAMLHQQSAIRIRRLPIFISLRDWADKKNNLITYIAKQFKICDFPQAENFVKYVLEQGSCLVLFDGLDEISQVVNINYIIREIRDFSYEYSSNQLVISCRIAAFNYKFEQYKDVEIADFNDEQINSFVKNWFNEKQRTGEVFLSRLDESERLKELATIPLMLTLMCILYEEDNDFSKSRVDLYERAIDALLTKWDLSRLIRRKAPHERLSIKHKKNLFTQIAFKTFLYDQYFFRKRELAKIIEDFMINMPKIDYQQLTIESQEILNSIEAQHGILVERARNIFSFAHLSFQEYFTAKYLADLDAPDLFEQIIKNHMYSPKWREVHILVVGMLPNPDKVFHLMLENNRKTLKNKELNQLLYNFQKDIIDSGINYSSVFQEALRFYIFLSLVLADDICLNGCLLPSKDQFRDLAHLISRDLLLVLDTTRDQSLLQKTNLIARAFNTLMVNKSWEATRIRDLVFNIAEDLDPVLFQDLIRIHNRAGNLFCDINMDLVLHRNVLPQFLAGNLLIINCLYTDCNVSDEMHRVILETLLTPLTEKEERKLRLQ